MSGEVDEKGRLENWVSLETEKWNGVVDKWSKAGYGGLLALCQSFNLCLGADSWHVLGACDVYGLIWAFISAGSFARVTHRMGLPLCAYYSLSTLGECGIVANFFGCGLIERALAYTAPMDVLRCPCSSCWTCLAVGL